MQKLANIVFIIILATMATVLPLNTEILNLNLETPVEVEPDTPPPLPIFTFKDMENKFHGQIGYGNNPVQKIDLSFISSTGNFDPSIKDHNLQLIIMQGKTEVRKINTRDLEYKEIEGKAVFTVNKDDLGKGLDPGYYSVMLIGEDGGQHGYWNMSTMDYKGEMLPMTTEIPAWSRIEIVYYPDAKFENIIPFASIKQTRINWINLYKKSTKGAEERFMMHPAPTVAVSWDYWISRKSIRVGFTSANLEPFENQELMFKAIGMTFAANSSAEKANIFVDNALKQEIDTTKKPRVYLPFTNDSNYIFLTSVNLKEDDKGGPATDDRSDATQEEIKFARYAKQIFSQLRANSVLPLGVNMTSARLDENGDAHVDMTENYSDILKEYPEYQKLMESCVILSLQSLPGVKKIFINEVEQTKILAYNITDEN